MFFKKKKKIKKIKTYILPSIQIDLAKSRFGLLRAEKMDSILTEAIKNKDSQNAVEFLCLNKKEQDTLEGKNLFEKAMEELSIFPLPSYEESFYVCPFTCEVQRVSKFRF